MACIKLLVIHLFMMSIFSGKSALRMLQSKIKSQKHSSKIIKNRQNEKNELANNLQSVMKEEKKNEFSSSTKIIQSLKSLLKQTAAWKHHDYQEMTWLLKYYNNSCSPYSYLYSIGSTVQNREIWVMALSESPEVHQPGKPEIKFLGNIRGNDFSTREILLHFIHFVCENIDKSPFLKSIFRNIRIHIAPSLNPDGYELARVRNRSNHFTGRLNANGVDLNRNFPGLFLAVNSDPEPETSHLMKWMSDIPFVLSISFQEGALVASYPFDDSPSGQSKYSATPDDDIFRKLARLYSENHPTMHQANNVNCSNRQHQRFAGGITNGAEWSSLTNTMQDYNYVNTNCFEITVDITCNHNTSSSDLPYLFEENIKSMLEFSKEALNGIRGFVFNENGIPLKGAHISVLDRRHDVTSASDGDFWRILLPGTYEVTAWMKGYSRESTNVIIKPEDNGVQVNFTLRKQGPDMSLITLGHVGSNKQSENSVFYHTDGRDLQEVVISNKGILTVEENGPDKSREDMSSRDDKYLNLKSDGDYLNGNNASQPKVRQLEFGDLKLAGSTFEAVTKPAASSLNDTDLQIEGEDIGNESKDSDERITPQAETTEETTTSSPNFEIGAYLKCDIPGRDKPLTGLLRWLGYIPELKKKNHSDKSKDNAEQNVDSEPLIAGLELESGDDLGSDGTFLGHRYFKTSPKRAYFVPAVMCNEIS